MNINNYRNWTPDEKITYFMDTLSITNKTPEYFINWQKVYDNTKKYELELTTMNYLIGKENINEEALNLFSQQPSLLKAIPALIASRDSHTDLLILEESKMVHKFLDFKNIDEENIDIYVQFMDDVGLLEFIQEQAKMSLVDYVYGVEAGLDSNARKNRSGSTMEKIVESFIIDIKEKVNLEFITQAGAKKIKSKWGKIVPIDKSSRRFDFAILNKDTDKLILIETNYYNGGGSKLKSVAGEFSYLNELIDSSDEDITFIWVTDGQGWKTSHFPLLEAYGKINYIFNLHMLSEGSLEDVIQGN